jgi:hypothetical protein
LNFCPNCGTRLSVEGLKFCPECGTNLRTTVSSALVPTAFSTPPQDSARAFELLKGELSSKAGDVAKSVGDSIIEKWKASGRYPKRFGKVIDALMERAVPTLVQMKIRSMPWKDEGVSVTSEGKSETSVSTSFPLELQTGIPLLGKVTLKEVKLTMRGLVDVGSGNVSQLCLGNVDLA